MADTLLDIVQNILNDMSSDEVNSISDTTEATQVAEIVKDTYFYMLAERGRPWVKTLTNLESAVAAFPTKMKIPDTVAELAWVKYDKKLSTDTSINMAEVTYLDPSDFLDRMYHRSEDSSNIEKYTDATYNVPFLVKNDTAPTYWTTFDDEYIIFDSYDSAADSVMQDSKSAIYAYVKPTWSMTDTYVPDLPDHMFPLLINMAKAASFENLKQVTSSTSERRTRKLTTRMQERQRRIDGKLSGPNYGRK